MIVRLKYITRLAYGEALPKDDFINGQYRVFGSNGPYAAIDHPNTNAPVIILGRKGSYGKINWVAEKCFASDTTFYIDDTCCSHNLRWLYFVLQTLRLDEGSSEAAVPGLNRDFVYEQKIVVFDVDQQLKISEFLDRETLRIDNLIKEKEKQLDLLSEKRQALITQAVTKGFNSKVKLQDSGIEWLGDVPEHWQIVKVSRIFSNINSGTTPDTKNQEYYTGGEINWVITGDLNDDIITDTTKRITEQALKDYTTLKVYPKGALCIAMYGATIGKTAILGVEACTNQACCVLFNSQMIMTEFAQKWFIAMRKQIMMLASGGGQPNISQGTIRDLKIALPPMSEQKAIMHQLNIVLFSISNLENETSKSIQLLKEKKSALIAAAVTGQLQIPS